MIVYTQWAIMQYTLQTVKYSCDRFDAVCDLCVCACEFISVIVLFGMRNAFKMASKWLMHFCCRLPLIDLFFSSREIELTMAKAIHSVATTMLRYFIILWLNTNTTSESLQCTVFHVRCTLKE